jgi:hypothetical protein
VASSSFGAAKKSRFPYWVIPTVIFVFGVGMFVGRAMDSDLTLMEFRDQKLTVADVIERLWPRRNEPGKAIPARTVVQRTEAENRLKTENARLMTEKDALVELVQTAKTALRAREESIKGLRAEINKLAQLNQQLVELNKENEKFKQQVALQRETMQKQRAVQTQVRPAARPVPQNQTAAVRPAVKEKPDPVAPSAPEPPQGPRYQVLRRTPILRNPADDAQILYYLNPGRSVQVNGIVDGRFMRVQYSRTGNPPGYVRVSDVMPLQ